ncbi:MAG TPA: diversity-generating retroelement protein bAvd family protein [Bacteroidales bacterium]|nr:MAG: hypothetical protein A2X11_03845 [Bacteroidetes bacterium GWE2_42_24]OFY26107.1 MAG: hypothetical protein A2X09_11660 [Bacteroidetes bacterium GWF2_43_11]HAQ65248.1 diversity-generating retroelement protein bAvd family protein [Bacteroidales bacterium]HBZ65419.1 diversity-generating retroelement protein bAvd family protein [Bacteroidales bacterium]
MRNFRDYDIWKEAITTARSVYLISRLFPSHEKFGLAGQMQRAGVSIGSNIAEGASRSSPKEFIRFLEMSIGSAFELETQMIIACETGYIANKDKEELIEPLL